MTKNNNNVNVYADSNYAVWTAATGTALPTTLPPTNPGAAYYEVGLLSDAGITEAHTLNETKIFDMAGSLVRVARNQEERPFTFVAMEGTNVVDSLRYPGSSVVTTGATAEVQTITLTGTGTAGTWTIASPNYGTASGLAYNISLAALGTALSTAFGITIATPTGTAGSSYVVTFPSTSGNILPMTTTNNITGVTAISVASTTPGVTGVNARAVGSGIARSLRVWVIDLVDGGVHKRIGINSGEAVWTGTTSYNGSSASLYEFTVQPYKDTAGNFYTILDDDPATAETFV